LKRIPKHPKTRWGKGRGGGEQSCPGKKKKKKGLSRGKEKKGEVLAKKKPPEGENANIQKAKGVPNRNIPKRRTKGEQKKSRGEGKEKRHNWSSVDDCKGGHSPLYEGKRGW